ncbi:unnamed protein product [Phaedon cochleariae]|uniref:Protein regulator of cytokinesis 1 n=1 Tax=Phaedon cochleariae TaxID=80249 RepID=A0A9N9X045_PHACE|nr:unnamed protein product [Phaedon cochleariae]
MEKSRIRKTFNDLQELDMNIIKGIPWAEEMWKVLSNGLEKTFLNWARVALKMEKKEGDMKEWVQTFILHYEDTCCELVSDMEGLQNDLITKIEESLQRVEELSKILQIEMPVFGYEKQSLYQERDQLKKCIEELEHTIEARKSELNKLQEKQIDLCHSLGRKMRTIQDDPLPSSEEVQEFQTYIEKLEQEKFERLEKFYTLKEEISVIIQELNFKPSTQFEKYVMSSDESKFLVTESNMRNLQDFLKTLEHEVKVVKEEVFELRNKINHYWNVLEIPFLEQEEFKQKYPGHTLEILIALRKEVERCENLKKANIKVFVERLRSQLLEIWDKCGCTESVRGNFRFLDSDCYTEDLLELHEFELKKWNDYYEEVKDIIALLNEHSKAWFKLIEFEESAVDPKRFKNRGGQLLKEEKERNALIKKIPKIESTLQEKANKYEQQNGTPFRTNGVTIKEYIWDLHSQKENARKQKLSARKIKHENTKSVLTQVLTPAKSVQCLFPVNPGTSTCKGKSASKRKLPATPALTSKRAKTSPGQFSTQSKKLTVPKITVNSVTLSKRHSTERKKRLEKIRRQSAQKKKHDDLKQSDTSTNSDYGEFETEISTRNDIRSTMLPETPSASRGVSRVNPRIILPNKGTPTALKKTTNNNNLKLATSKSDLNLMF